MFVKRINVSIALLLMLTMVLAACQPAAPESPAEEEAPAAVEAEAPAAEEEAVVVMVEEGEKEMVSFADSRWQSIQLLNAVAMFILKNGYGYPVESVVVTTPIIQESLPAGELDVCMELWSANIEDWWNEVRENGNVVVTGTAFESPAQAWFTPRYITEGDAGKGLEPLAPDLKTVADLPRYWNLFEDPEDSNKGVFISCITAWECAEINRIKMYAYGLEEYYNIQEPGSSGALDAAITGAYKKNEPILAYYWEPSWLLGAYDMVKIEEPEYTDECWATIKGVQGGGVVDASIAADVPVQAGCAYEKVEIPMVINAGFAERNPRLLEFFNNMFVGIENTNKVLAHMTETSAGPEEGAIWYLQNHEDQWRGWVPEDVAKKVAAALK